MGWSFPIHFDSNQNYQRNTDISSNLSATSLNKEPIHNHVCVCLTATKFQMIASKDTETSERNSQIVVKKPIL